MIDFRFFFGKFVPGSQVSAITTKSEISPIESDVMWVTESVANAISAFTRFDTLAVAVADQAVGANATRVAQVRHRRAWMRILMILTTAFARPLVAFLVDGAILAAID